MDITQSSLENKTAPAQSARAVANAMFTRADSPFRVASWMTGVEGAELSELKQRAALHRRRLFAFLAVIVALELFLSVVR